jgi:hypothetical protein
MYNFRPYAIVFFSKKNSSIFSFAIELDRKVCEFERIRKIESAHIFWLPCRIAITLRVSSVIGFEM